MRRSVLLFPLAALFLALSGFDCAGSSAQMTTAKVALQRKDYAAAAAALEKEVELRPGNGVAWFTLAEIYDQQERPVDAMRAIEKARVATQPKLEAAQLEDTYIRQFNLWRNTYNRALNAYRKEEFRRALTILDTAQMVGPDYTENIYFRGTINEDLGDEAAATAAYREYVQKVTPMVEVGSKLGLALRMSPESVEAKLGKPTRMQLDDTTGGYYYYAPQNLYVYYAPPTTERGLAVEGWNVFDATVPERLRAAPVLLRADPYAILGINAQKAKSYDEALRYLQALSRLDPARPGVSASITQIYLDTDQVDQAIASIRAQIAADPKDARSYIDLGNLYFGSKRPGEAIKAFESALALGLPSSDENVRTALFNLGAVYKNWGARLQDSIKEVSKGKPTKAQTDVYLAPLRESVKYFERYRGDNPNEFAVLVELGNLYDVLGDTGNRDKLITALEGLSSSNAQNKEYWRSMSRLYALIGDAKKAEAADKKADSLP